MSPIQALEQVIAQKKINGLSPNLKAIANNYLEQGLSPIQALKQATTQE